MLNDSYEKIIHKNWNIVSLKRELEVYIILARKSRIKTVQYSRYTVHMRQAETRAYGERCIFPKDEHLFYKFIINVIQLKVLFIEVVLEVVKL